MVNRVLKAVLALVVFTALFMDGKLDTRAQPVMPRVQHEKEKNVHQSEAVILHGITMRRVKQLENAVDSLEAKLERAHVVAVRDSVRVENWLVNGFSYGYDHFEPTDSTFLGLIWHRFTRYEISFEPDPARSDQ